jgi:cyclic 2,3-diphosphoglycerate synthetase
VVQDALDRLERDHEIVAVLFAGGEEKVRARVLDEPAAHYGRSVTLPAAGDVPGSLRDLAAGVSAEVVIDLSGEPVLGPDDRMRLAAVAVGCGLEYRAPGMMLTPPVQEQVPGAPVVAVIGTGKRVGKTALAGHLATLLRERGERPVIVSMGRGGPAEPQVMPAGEAPDAEGLLALARAGSHAASDYLEDAVLTGVATVGCRRCGEGPAGGVFDSSAVEGVRVAMGLDPSLVVLEGSGSGIPPVSADRTVCVVGAHDTRATELPPLAVARLLRSQLVVLLGAEGMQAQEVRVLTGELQRWTDAGTVVASRLVPEPVSRPGPGTRIALFTTARTEAVARLRAELEQQGLEIAVASANLARREALERDLESAARAGCEVYLTELKAAAIDIVAERAQAAGAEVVFLRHRPQSLPGEASLDDELLALCAAAVPA